jgi:hypothetical protein
LQAEPPSPPQSGQVSIAKSPYSVERGYPPDPLHFMQRTFK